ERSWGVSERQLRRYLSAAHRRIREILDQEQHEVYSRHLMQRRAIYARCLKANDLRAALGVLKDEAHLHGLYPHAKTKSQPEHPPSTAAEPDGALVDILPELQAALDRLGPDPGPADPASPPATGGAGVDPPRSGSDHASGGAAPRSLAD